MDFTEIPLIINNSVEKAQLARAQLTNGCISLHFKYNDIDIIVEDERPHIALRKLRQLLETQNILLATDGCRKDVHASGMQIDMRTSSAYIHTMGEPSSFSNVVGIFEPTNEIDKICTIAEQEEFNRNWMQSLKNRTK